MKKAYTAVYGLIAVLIAATIIISYNGNKHSEPYEQIADNEQVNNNKDVPYREITTEAASQQTTAAERISEKSTQAAASAAKEKKENKEQKTNSVPETKKDITTAQFDYFDDTQDMAWPVIGKVVMNYSMDTAVYDATLEQYRTNDSISIAAQNGTPVHAAADGIVELIYDDETGGKSIVLNHGNGWLTTYSQLSDDVCADIGDTVNKGQEIATVTDPTKYGSALGSHLDFKVTCNNEPYDPNLVLSQFDE